MTFPAPTLVTSCTTLPPEGALRLRPGKAGSAAPACSARSPAFVTLWAMLPTEELYEFG